MASQQSSLAPQTEQKGVPAGPPSFAKEQWAAFTEEEWEAAAAATLRAEIDRMDAVAASTAATATEDKFVMIDGPLYVKAWLISEKEESPEAGMRSQS